MSENILKPCPFCGATKYLKITYQDSKANASIQGDQKYWGVFCMEGCCASIDSVYPTREEAIKAWNTRATPQQPIDGNTSDGYHTFNELYDHRCLLWINYCLTNPDKVYLVENHFDGWFLLGKETAWGQISYHCPNKFFNLVEKFERRHPEFDGHTSNDVINRLVDMAKPQQPSEPLKELDEQAVSDELQLRYFKLMFPDVTESDAEIVANSLSKAICSKFGQPSEKKALSVEEECPKDLLEKLAAIEHERWSGWMRHQFSKGRFTEKNIGEWIMPVDRVAHWQKLMNTPYADLSEQSKEMDRIEVRKTWKAIHSALPARKEVKWPEKKHTCPIHPEKRFSPLACSYCAEDQKNFKLIDEFKKLNGG